MFEKLRKYRADRERYLKKIEEFQKKVDALDENIRSEEATSIVGVINLLQITPEKAAERLGYIEEERKPAPKKPAEKNSDKNSDKKESIGSANNAAENNDYKIEGDVLNEVF
ncbi:MAG: DUF4315 family protein [Butyrivibrio sp.]|jgi:hypothetical protein|nr:DUF4315 family protein [Butyrivibrio sp.]MBR4667782.1 DUF4315 family protein [Butyrivibrio sp.]